MQRNQTIKINQIELMIQTGSTFYICLQTNRKPQFGLMVECLFAVIQ